MFSRRRIEPVYYVIVVAGILGIYFFIVHGKETSVDFTVSFTAGLLGIMAGLLLNRVREQAKDNETKKDFLALMRNELTEIRSRIPPQTKIPLLLYPEVWDSFVSSGLMRLLSVEQVTKLSSVYRFIKGTQYEAEWVRRKVEELSSFPDEMEAEKELLKRRYRFLQDAYERHGAQLTKEIDEILKETWLS